MAENSPFDSTSAYAAIMEFVRPYIEAEVSARMALERLSEDLAASNRLVFRGRAEREALERTVAAQKVEIAQLKAADHRQGRWPIQLDEDGAHLTGELYRVTDTALDETEQHRRLHRD